MLLIVLLMLARLGAVRLHAERAAASCKAPARTTVGAAWGAAAIAAGTLAGTAGTAYLLPGLHADAADSESVGRAAGREFVADAVAAAMPAVVSVSYMGPNVIGHGSGFVIRSEWDSKRRGYVNTVLTNAHVVGRRSDVTVTLNDGRAVAATVALISSSTDLAVLRCVTPERLPVVAIGSSADARIGQFAIALGSPSRLRNTATLGILSAKRPSSELGVLGPSRQFLQTDAAINQGNSGGPLVDANGRVIGVLVLKALLDGISFAIPIDEAMFVVQQLEQDGYESRPYLGVRIVGSPGPGAVVYDVEKNSPADQAGLCAGDVIVSFDGDNVARMQDVLQAVANPSVAGRGIPVVLDRKGERVQVTVTPRMRRVTQT